MPETELKITGAEPGAPSIKAGPKRRTSSQNPAGMAGEIDTVIRANGINASASGPDAEAAKSDPEFSGKKTILEGAVRSFTPEPGGPAKGGKTGGPGLPEPSEPSGPGPLGGLTQEEIEQLRGAIIPNQPIYFKEGKGVPQTPQEGNPTPTNQEDTREKKFIAARTRRWFKIIVGTAALGIAGSYAAVYGMELKKERELALAEAKLEKVETAEQIREKMVEAIHKHDEETLNKIMENADDHQLKLRLNKLSQEEFIRLLELLNKDQLERVMKQVSKEGDERELKALLSYFDEQNGNFSLLLTHANKTVSPRLISCATNEQLENAIKNLSEEDLANTMSNANTENLKKIIRYIPIEKLAAVLPQINKEDLSGVMNTMEEETLKEVISLLNTEKLISFLANADASNKSKILDHVSNEKLAQAINKMNKEQLDELFKKKELGIFMYLSNDQAIGILGETELNDLTQILENYYSFPWIVNQIKPNESQILEKVSLSLNFEEIFEPLLEKWQETHDPLLINILIQSHSNWTGDENVEKEFLGTYSAELETAQVLENKFFEIAEKDREYALIIANFIFDLTKTPRYNMGQGSPEEQKYHLDRLMYEYHRWDHLTKIKVTSRGNKDIFELIRTINKGEALESEMAIYFGVSKLEKWYKAVEESLLEVIKKDYKGHGSDAVDTLTEYAYKRGVARKAVKEMEEMYKNYEREKTSILKGYKEEQTEDAKNTFLNEAHKKGKLSLKPAVAEKLKVRAAQLKAVDYLEKQFSNDIKKNDFNEFENRLNSVIQSAKKGEMESVIMLVKLIEDIKNENFLKTILTKVENEKIDNRQITQAMIDGLSGPCAESILPYLKRRVEVVDEKEKLKIGEAIRLYNEKINPPQIQLDTLPPTNPIVSPPQE